jgi:hypothetical protein
MMDMKSLGDYLLHFLQDVVIPDCFVDDSMGAPERKCWLPFISLDRRQ